MVNKAKGRTGELPGSGAGGDRDGGSKPPRDVWTTEDEKILLDLGNGASPQAVMRLHGISLDVVLAIQSRVHL